MLARRVQVNGPEDERTLGTRSNLGYLAMQRGDYDEARDSYGAVLAIRERTLGPHDEATIGSRNNYASALRGLGDYDEAAEQFSAVLDPHLAQGRTEHPYTLATMGSLAWCYSELGRHDEAIDLHARSVAIKRKVLPTGSISMIIGLANYGGALLECERYVDAEPLLTEAVTMSEEHLGPTDQRTLTARQRLATLHQRTGRLTEARDALLEVLDGLAARVAPDHPLVLESKAILARTYLDLGTLDEAETHATAAYRRTVETTPEHQRRGRFALLLARIRLAQGDHAAAREFADEAIDRLDDKTDALQLRESLPKEQDASSPAGT